MKALTKKLAEPGIWMEDIAEPEYGPNDILIQVRIDDVVPPLRTKTDDAGRYELDWLPPGTQELHASSRLEGTQAKARGRVEAEAGASYELDLRLSFGALVRGRVVDAQGQALEGWVVRAEPDMYGLAYPRRAETGADGHFLVANLGEGAYTLKVAAPGESSTTPRATPAGGAAKNRLDAGHQLTRLKGLAQVIIRAEFETRNPIDHVATRRQHDDRYIVGLAHLAHDFETVLARQHDVQQQEIRLSRIELRHARLGFAGAIQLDSVSLQERLEELGVAFVVVDE